VSERAEAPGFGVVGGFADEPWSVDRAGCCLVLLEPGGDGHED